MDITLLLFFNKTVAYPFLDLVMLGVTIGALGVLAGLGVVLLFGEKRRVGLAILASLIAGLIMTLVFQFLALRPRPENVRLLWPTPNFPSYPSGHAVAAFATATVIGLAYRRWSWWGIGLMGAGLVALSRVYLGHHYPSDVLGGAVLGAAVGAAGYGLIAAPRSNQSPWRWLLWPQVAVVLLVTHMAYLGILPLHLLYWPWADKALHFLLFGAVVFWLNIWFEGRSLEFRYWSVPLAVLIPFTIALAEEGLQSFSPLRTADLGDLLSDLIGMLVFLWLSRRLTFLGNTQLQGD